MSYLILDLETTTYVSKGRKASPFDARNWIVLIGWQGAENCAPCCERYTRDTQARAGRRFAELLTQPGLRYVVGHNIKFDLLHLFNIPQAREAWIEFVANGGRVWDTQLAEYLLEGHSMESQMTKLNTLADKYGLDMKLDEVKALWDAGVQTDQIDPSLLQRYLIGEDLIDPATGAVTGRQEGDIGITRGVFHKQAERMRKADIGKLLATEMGALAFSTEMEHNGVYINKQLGLELAKELEVEIAQAQKELLTELPPNLPFEFEWTNRFHLSPLLFGGVVKYDGYEWDLAGGFTTTEKPPVPGGVYPNMTVRGYLTVDNEYVTEPPVNPDDPGFQRYKSGKFQGQVVSKNIQLPNFDKPKGRQVKLPYTFPRMIAPKEEWQSDTPGLWSVAEEVRDYLVVTNPDIPFLAKLGRLAGMSKDLRTYFITTDENGKQHGMLALVGEDGKVHANNNHTSTFTSRMSSSKPNTSNIPSTDKSRLKETMESQFDDGVIIQTDSNSLEVHTQAIVTDCKPLIEDLRNGIDMHCVRLAVVTHKPYEEVLELVSTDPVWKHKRKGIKAFSFQLAFGAGAPSIAKATGLTIEEVEALIEAEDNRYPEINEFHKRYEAIIEQAAVPTPFFAKHPHLGDKPVLIRQSLVKSPTVQLYSFRSVPSPGFLAQQGVLTVFPRQARMNYFVQGTGAQNTKAAMSLYIMELYRRKLYESIKPNLVIHDSIASDSQRELRDEAMVLQHACMEEGTAYLGYTLKMDFPILVPATTVYGRTLAEENPAAEIPGFLGEVKIERKKLRDRYMNGYQFTHERQ